ncbi:MAG: hypothetical protein Q7L55_09120 [Actinomycetota bacterium]|nr:hypothetical protein [Actinomycetota bacterium]
MATVQTIIESLHKAGVTVTPEADGRLLVKPASHLTDELRSLVRQHKVELLSWLTSEPENAPEPIADPAAWRELATAYHVHHFSCHVCIAAGRSSRFGLRCGVGAALWYAYNQ